MEDRQATLSVLGRLHDACCYQLNKASFCPPAVSQAVDDAAQEACMEDLGAHMVDINKWKDVIRMAQSDLRFLRSHSVHDTRTPFLSWMLVRDQILCAAALDSLGYPTSGVPPIDSFPLGHFNAVAIAAPGHSQCAIIIDRGVKYLTNLITKVLVLVTTRMRLMPALPSSTADIRTLLMEHSDALQLFQACLLSYFFREEPPPDPHASIPPAETKLRVALEHSADLFVIGHEVAHIVCGHLQNRNTRSLSAVRFDEIDFDWNAEYEADALGIQLVMRTMRPLACDDGVIPCVGVALTMQVIEMLEKSKALASFGDANKRALPTTHPSPASRKRALDGHVRRTLQPSANKAYLALTEINAIMLALLLDLSSGHLLQYHAKNVPLRPSFRD